jgi:hypothetical protein
MSRIIPFVLCVGSEQLPLEMGVVCDPDNKDPAIQSALYGLAFLVRRLAVACWGDNTAVTGSPSAASISPFDLIQARCQIDQVLRDDAVAGKDRSLLSFVVEHPL